MCTAVAPFSAAGETRISAAVLSIGAQTPCDSVNLRARIARNRKRRPDLSRPITLIVLSFLQAKQSTVRRLAERSFAPLLFVRRKSIATVGGFAHRTWDISSCTMNSMN
jgi:hypothetical protein